MYKHCENKQKGSVMILACFSLVFLLGCAGIVIDMGNIYLEKIKMQNAVDSAVLAGGQELPDTTVAKAISLEYIGTNGQNPEDVNISFSKQNRQINVVLQKKAATYFAAIFGIKDVIVSAYAAAILTNPPGVFDYAIFSGSTMIQLPLNGSGFTIKGAVHTNQNLVINGSYITITKTAEAVGTITTNGNNIKIASLQNKTAFASMPDYSNEVAAAAAAVNQVVNGDKTMNGSNIATGSTYVKGNLTVNGSNFTASGTILADGGITINGSGMAAMGSQICFYAKNGDIIVNGSGYNLNGVLYAPHGRIIINGGGLTVNGSVVGNQVVINGGNFSVNRDDYPITALPEKHVQLISAS